MNNLFKSFFTIRGFIKKEFSQILRDTKMRIVLFVLPVVQLVVFAVAISTEVKNIKIGFMNFIQLIYKEIEYQRKIIIKILKKLNER